MRSFRYNLKRKSADLDDVDTWSPADKKKMETLNSYEVQIHEDSKISDEDYKELKETAKRETAKRSTTASTNQIMHCMQQTFLNRYIVYNYDITPMSK